MDKLISIIIPVYKVEQYLNRCIESIVNQAYKNLEIILVDDGSPDKCPDICDSWKQMDSRIKVIHKVNGGVSSARNSGIECVRGDYIVFIDSDDYITNSFSNCLEKLDNQDLIICPFYNNEPKERNIVGNKVNGGSWIASKPSDFSQNSVWTKIIKTELIKEHKLSLDCLLRIAEDFKFCMQVIMCAKTIEYINVPYYVYFCNEQSVMSNITYSKICDTMTACEHVIKLLSQTLDKDKILYMKKMISENLLSVAFRSGMYKNDENAELIKRLKTCKKYIKYGSNMKKKLASLFINMFGITLFSKISKLLKKRGV